MAQLFTCSPKRGGCGGHAIIQPPQMARTPNLEHAFIVGMPLTPEQASRVLEDYGQPA
jgi:hypothetical protein